MQGNNKFLVVVFIQVFYNYHMNKVAGIGIAVVVIAVIIVAAMSFNDDSGTTGTTGTTVTQTGPFTVESSQEISQEETDNGTDHYVVLTEKIGIKAP